MEDRKDRREELADAAEGMQRELFAGRVGELKGEYRKEGRRASVKQAFADVLRLWDGEGGRKAGSLGICYLFSGMAMRTYEFRLALYGEDFYLDGYPAVRRWKPPCFFEMFEEDMAVIMKKLRKVYPRIYAYEEDAVRRRCVEYYLAAVRQLCEDMAEEIVCMEEFLGMEKTDNFFIFFGAYRGEGDILYCVSKDGIGCGGL